MRNNLLLIVGGGTTRDTLQKNLHHGYNIFVANNLDEIPQVFEKASIELIICSVDMPALEGWQLCAQFKTSSRYAHIPVILLAGEDSLEVKIKALEAGADACIHPATPWKYLNAQINNLIINRIKVSRYIDSSLPVHNNFSNSNNDEELIDKMNNCIYKNLHDPLLDVGLLAKLMNMSRPTLYRKIRAITTRTPNELINEARLKRAAEQLETGEYKVFEIASMVGFHSQSSFGKAFLKHYKVTPVTWQRIKKKQRLQDGNPVQPATFKTLNRSLLALSA